MTADHSARTGQRRGDEERGQDRIAKLVYTVARSTPKKPYLYLNPSPSDSHLGQADLRADCACAAKKATDDCVQGDTFVCG